MNWAILLLLSFFLLSCGKDITTPTDVQSSTTSVEESDSSRVLLNPKVYAPSVRKFFFQKEVLPSTDKRYVQVLVSRDSTSKSLNNLNLSKGTKEVLIKAKHLVLNAGHQQGVFEQLNNMVDITKVTIEAEIVDVFDKISIPNASVYISAREINFSSGGQVDITPLGYSDKATLPSEGKVGLDAGEVILNVKNVNFSKGRTKALFILNGGEGQGGSLGAKGVNGSKVRDLGRGVIFRAISKESCEMLDNPIFERDRFKFKNNKRLVCSSHSSSEGSRVWPTDGGNATAGSAPGIGGKGGWMRTHIAIPKKLVSVKGGKSGESSGVTKGGSAGVPKVSYHQSVFIDRNNTTHLRSNTKRVSSSGADAKAPEAKKGRGEDGKFEISPLLKLWQAEGYLEKELLYANDLYLSNYIEESKTIFRKLDESLNLFGLGDRSIKGMALRAKVNENFMKINSQRDFFGNSLNWVPNFSFEANFSKFRSDLKYSMETLYLTYWIRNSQKSLESKLKAMEEVQTKLLEDIEVKKENYSNLISKLPVLNEKIDTFRVEEDYFSKEVRRVEIEIAAMARDNIIDRNKVPLFKKTLRTLSAISTAIPAGQPALGLIGSSLQVLSGHIGVNNSLGEIIEDSSSIYKNFQNLKLEESSSAWNESWSKVKLSRIKEINSKRELKEYLSDISEFSKPIIAAAQEQASEWRKKEVPRSEIAKEIQKIKGTHAIFKDLSQKLESFMHKKNILVREVQEIQSEITSTLSSIYSSFDKVSELSHFKKNLLDGSDLNITNFLDSLEEDTTNRILKYHYEVARAYEYRLLRPYRKNINLIATLEKMQSIVEANTETFLSSKEFDILRVIYTSELASIAENILYEFSGENFPLQREKVLQFNNAELDALNDGKDIYLDLMAKDFFPEDMQDIRINSILVESLDVDSEGSLGRSEEISLEIAYSGESYIKKGGDYYFFKKDINSQKTKWGSTFDLISGEQSEILESPTANSLIYNLLGQNSENKIMLLSRPGGLTQLKVRLRKDVSPEVQVSLHSAKIRIIYDYNTF